MKRVLIIVAVAVVVTGVALVAWPRQPVWTTTSEVALRELQAGLDAQMKLYNNEARSHFEKAVEADPGFTIAKLFLYQTLDAKDQGKKRDALADDIRSADTSKLSPRERFLVATFQAHRNRDEAAAEKITDETLAKYPDDPFALNARAGRAFAAGRFEDAAADFRRLAEVAPNWVTAYNQLGYIEMAQGRFADAEKMFRKYRFIAPDQANPHDSLGELLAITGKYDDARQEFEEALAVKPDFCLTYLHLVLTDLLAGDPDAADAIVARVERVPQCANFKSLAREVATWRAYMKRDWSGVIAAAGYEEKAGYDGSSNILAHAALCRLGRWADAEAIERKLSEGIAKNKARGGSPPALEAALLHEEGMRLLLMGQPEAAVPKLRAVDGLLVWRGLDDGVFKLYNLAVLARAQRAAGDQRGAEATLQTLRSVNPTFAAAVTAGRTLVDQS